MTKRVALSALLGLLCCASPAAAATHTFSFTGAAEPWAVPAGVSVVKFDVLGAQGGAFGGVAGGLGGSATATLAVTPAEMFQIFVGGQGGNETTGAGGFNGGAVSGAGADHAGGGGGASDVRRPTPFSLADRVIVAGGGGGAIDGFAGGDGGGTAGEAGKSSSGNVAIGGGATQVAGGAPGADSGPLTGVAGTIGTAGVGGAGTCLTTACGGGGGGGLWGGGGGGFDSGATVPGPGGGGGGSGLTPNTLGMTSGVRAGNGMVTAMWDTVTINAPVNGVPRKPTDSIAADYSCTDAIGGDPQTCEGDIDGTPVANGADIPLTAGTRTFTVTAKHGTTTTATKSVTFLVDGTNPTAAITTPVDGAEYELNENVPADYSCGDEVGGSGLVSCVGTVADNAPIPTSTLGPHAFTVTATDGAGNIGTQTVNYTVVDATPPTVAVTAPVTNAEYTFREHVNAAYSCADEAGGSGIASCIGDVPVGNFIDTNSLGTHFLEVTATDNGGNVTSRTIGYTVRAAPVPPRGPLCNERKPTIMVKRGQGLVRGTAKGDVILGSDGNDRIDGRGGRDMICGGKGNDRLVGGASSDTVFGGDGNDTLAGGSGNDRLYGERGNDRLGLPGQGGGQDTLFGGPGRDAIRAEGDFARDKVSCGAARDSVFADPFDRLADCERVRILPRPIG